MKTVKSILTLTVALILACVLCVPAFADFYNEEPTAEQRALSDQALAEEYRALFTKESITADGFSTTLGYRLYVPDDYDENRPYPVILFLHGAGESNNGGNTNEAQLDVGMMNLFFQKGYHKKFPCIIIAPQVPKSPNGTTGEWVNTSWKNGSYEIKSMTETGPTFTENIQLAKAAVDETAKKYNVDPDRVYVTGISMGGYGTWNIITHYNDFFAAAVPICGAGDPGRADRLLNMPIWCFHGDEDTAVPTKGSQDMYNAITAAGGDKINYTEWIKTGHAWLPAYCREDVWTWLFSQAKNTADKKELEDMLNSIIEFDKNNSLSAEDNETAQKAEAFIADIIGSPVITPKMAQAATAACDKALAATPIRRETEFPLWAVAAIAAALIAAAAVIAVLIKKKAKS